MLEREGEDGSNTDRDDGGLVNLWRVGFSQPLAPSMSRRTEDLTIRNHVLTCCAAVKSTRRVKTVRRLACREADALPADRVMPMRLIPKMMPTISYLAQKASR